VNTTAQVALPLTADLILPGFAASWVTPGCWAPTHRRDGAVAAVSAAADPLPSRNTPHVKLSGVERLGIRDYISAHVLQRPTLRSRFGAVVIAKGESVQGKLTFRFMLKIASLGS